MSTKYEDIYDNYYNGKITDFKKQIAKTSKVKLCQLFQWIRDNISPDAMNKVINFLARQ